MATLGDELRAAREKKGLTLKEVSEKTRISGSFLRALEEEDFSAIPGDVFVAGFLRTYARELGLDEKQVLARYREMRVPPPPPQEAAEEPQHKPKPSLLRIGRSSEQARPFPIYAVIAAGLILGVLITGLAMFITRRPETPPAVQPATPPPAMPPATTVMKHATSFQQKTSIKPASAAKREAAPEPEAKEAPAKGPLTLKLTAVEDSWYSYRADGGTREHGILRKGNTLTIRAEDRVLIDVGNAGGVTAELNGKRLPPLGVAGRPVKNLVFGNTGRP